MQRELTIKIKTPIMEDGTELRPLIQSCLREHITLIEESYWAEKDNMPSGMGKTGKQECQNGCVLTWEAKRIE